MRAQPILCEIVHFFHEWRPIDDFVAARPHLDRKVVSRLFAELVDRSVLQRRTGRVTARERLMDTWSDWNPAAGFFHHSTKDLDYADLKTIERLTRQRAQIIPQPPPVKKYPGATVLPLPTVRVAGEFPDVLLGRRTWRRFSGTRIEKKDFSTLLALTGGVQAWVGGSNGQKVPLKTSPSGGARHSIELYAMVTRVRGVAPGLYHYAADKHALERVATRRSGRIEQYLPTQWWFERASAVVFLTAVFPRVQWRYTHARAYRAVLIEAGHVCQTFCLTATWLGLAPFCSMALADSRIERDLKLDGVTESVLYAAGVGARPPAVHWNPSRREGAKPPVVTHRTSRTFPGLVPSQSAR